LGNPGLRDERRRAGRVNLRALGRQGEGHRRWAPARSRELLCAINLSGFWRGPCLSGWWAVAGPSVESLAPNRAVNRTAEGVLVSAPRLPRRGHIQPDVPAGDQPLPPRLHHHLPDRCRTPRPPPTTFSSPPHACPGVATSAQTCRQERNHFPARTQPPTRPLPHAATTADNVLVSAHICPGVATSRQTCRQPRNYFSAHAITWRTARAADDRTGPAGVGVAGVRRSSVQLFRPEPVAVLQTVNAAGTCGHAAGRALRT
jgi:hypothetical protein